MSAHGVESEDRLYTIHEYEQLPDDDRYRDELVRGQLVREPRPGNEHGMVQLNLASELRQYVRERGLGIVRVETGYVLEPGVATVRGPDVSFVARERVPPGGLPRGLLRMAPDLAVEIVSPSNTTRDLRVKTREYLDAGVRQVWVIDPRTRSVAVHASGAPVRVLREDEEMDGGDVVPGFRSPVAALFLE